MKKFISIILSVLMLVSVFTVMPLTASAYYDWYEEGKNDDFEYLVYKDYGYVAVYKYLGKDSEVVIPDTIEGYPVEKIGGSIFDGCDFITKITLPDTITEVSEDAFADTAFYNNDDNWEDGALYLGSILVAVDESREGEFTVKDGTTVIARYAFLGCEKLTKVTVPGTVKYITEKLFFKCISLESIVLEEGVEDIDEMVFYGCNKLEDIKLPKSITRVGYQTFVGTGFYNNDYNWENGALYYDNILITVDSECEGNFTVKDGTTVLGDYAFDQCNVENIYLPDGIKTLPYAFANNCLWIKSIHLGDGLEELNSYSLSDAQGFELPESVKKIGYRAFMSSKITELTLPENLKEIDVEAFLSCTHLKEVTIPKNVEKIGYEALGYRFSGIGGNGYVTERVPGLVIKGYPGTVAETYAKENDFEFVDLTKEPATEPTTEPVTAAPTTEPTTVAPTTAPVISGKKANPVKVTANTKTVKAKKLKSKKQTVKPLKIKNAQGKVSVTILKSGTSSKIYKKLSVNSKGAVTLKKGKYAKGTYKVKLRITAKGNANYKSASVNKTVKIKVK